MFVNVVVTSYDVFERVRVLRCVCITTTSIFSNVALISASGTFFFSFDEYPPDFELYFFDTRVYEFVSVDLFSQPWSVD